MRVDDQIQIKKLDNSNNPLLSKRRKRADKFDKNQWIHMNRGAVILFFGQV